MPTAQCVVRVEDPLMEAVMKRAAAEGLRGKSEPVRAALREYAGSKGEAACRELAARCRTLEAELARARSALARYEAGGEAGPSAEERDRAIADLIRGATPENPATPAGVVAVSGLGYRQALRILAGLVKTGYGILLEKGRYVAAPGKDPLEGMGAIRGRVAALNGASGGSGEAGGASPAPVPAEPVTEATGPAEAQAAATVDEAPRTARTERPAARKRPPARTRPPVAAKGRQVAVAELRERGDLVTASELPAPTVFQAGPDVDCLHENMRVRKGVCPDCKQWVTK